MRLFKEIGENIPGGIAPCGRCLLYTGGGGYFQGVKSFDAFSEKGVTLRFSDGEMRVDGERFSVAKYRGEDFELRGKISGLRFFKKGKKNGGTESESDLAREIGRGNKGAAVRK